MSQKRFSTSAAAVILSAEFCPSEKEYHRLPSGGCRYGIVQSRHVVATNVRLRSS